MAVRFNLADMNPDLAVAALRDVKRADKAAEIPDNDIRPTLDIDEKPIQGMFEVRSQTRRSQWYEVDLLNANGPTCCCMDWTENKVRECKHIKAAKLYDAPKLTPELVVKTLQKQRGDCLFNPETCGPTESNPHGCMLYQNCKAYAEAKLAWALRLEEARRTKQ